MDKNAIGLILLCTPFAVPLIVGLFWLSVLALRAFASSRASWIASVLVLPHFTSKVMDRAYDAYIAGNFGDAAWLSIVLAFLVAAIARLLRSNGEN